MPDLTGPGIEPHFFRTDCIVLTTKFLLFFNTAFNVFSTTNLEYDLTAFDKVVHELEIQNLQHSDILKTAERLK